MPNKRVILVTGVSGYWGGKVVSRLLTQSCAGGENGHGPQLDLHVIGMDANPPETELQELDFIQADVRNPLLVDLLRSEQVHTVVHLAFHENSHASESDFDINVMGTMKVLGACAEAGIRKVILKSSTAVYGAAACNPAFITEEAALNGSRTVGTIRDMVEIEAFCNGFRRQVPEMVMTILRFPNIIGPDIDSPMTRFLREPLAPVLMGFDPMMQIIHERDVVDAILHAVQNDIPGVFNVAAEGAMPLTRMMALAGKLPVPVFHLFAYWGSNLLGNSRLGWQQYLPLELDYIRFPWVGDLSRMREEFCYTPRYTAEEALREFAGQQRLRRYLPESAALAYDEERLRDTIERRRRVRERVATGSVEQMEAQDE